MQNLIMTNNKVSLNELSKSIHQDNVERGFYDDPRQIGTLLMLVVSELSEALEADRKNKHCSVVEYALTPEGELDVEKFKEKVKDTFEDEIADAFIRLFDLCGYLNIDIEKHIALKLAYNRTRGYKHGKNY